MGKEEPQIESVDVNWNMASEPIVLGFLQSIGDDEGVKHSLKDSHVIVSVFYNRCRVPSRSVLPGTGGKPVESWKLH